MSTYLYQKEKSFLSKLNFKFLFIIGLLILISLANFYSITHTATESSSKLFWTQTLWISIGLCIFFLLSAIHYQWIARFSYVFYFINLLALVLVLFFGKTFNGAQRWFDFGFFSYQPSETMKIALIALLAHLLSKKSVQQTYGLRQVIFIIMITLLPIALIASQPDLGTALVLGIQVVTVVLFLNLNRSLWISLIVFIAVITPSMWLFVLKDYQKSRILTFISSQQDPQGAGYNIIQSKIAVGSGRLFGKGFKKGTQSQLDFLPERKTDFIFSALSEEHGFIGSLVVIGLFALLLIHILKIASQSRNKLGVYFCLGSLSIIFWQIIINISMAIGLLPVVGIPLPLLSYGGSNILTIFTALGLISSVSVRRYIYS